MFGDDVTVFGCDFKAFGGDTRVLVCDTKVFTSDIMVCRGDTKAFGGDVKMFWKTLAWRTLSASAAMLGSSRIPAMFGPA